MEDPNIKPPLCQSCGFCCDGTLFSTVPLETADALPPLEAGGIKIRMAEKGPYFQQPCAAYQHGYCQIYADRPSSCRKYRCKLLKQYESETVSWDEAQERIARVRKLKEFLMDEQARVPGIGSEMSVAALRNTTPPHAKLAKDPALLKTWAPLTMRLALLLDFLQMHFQPPARG
jgi:Fe-S-cluster containining protein